MKKQKLEIPEFWKQYDRPVSARVMTICDGYAMLRYPGCVPFCVSVKDLSAGTYGWYSTIGPVKRKQSVK